MTELEKEVERLQGRVGQLRGDLHEAEGKLRDAKERLAGEKYGVAVGSIVKSRKGEFRVVGIDTRSPGKPWLNANPRKKDGSFGTAHRALYSDWELVTP